MFKINHEEALARPITTYDQIYADARRIGIFADTEKSCLMEAEEFLKLFSTFGPEYKFWCQQTWGRIKHEVFYLAF